MPRTFLVVENNEIVARDLSETLLGTDPGAQVLVADTTAEAIDMTSELASLSAVFLGIPLAAISETGLHQLIEERGGRLVVSENVMAEALSSGEPAVILPRPFTTEMVLEALKQATSDLG
ncbi:MAG: hypothetical protein HKN63_03250 [Rhodobacteraceae bacterium]|nr:hypothetical protein [Paracoccaceae bacterium]